MQPLVTLTTDFGTASGYVAQLKGAFFRRLQSLQHTGETLAAASCNLLDLAHDVPPHDVVTAGWLVASSCFSFPHATLHVVVIDPGVGTARPVLYAEIGDQRFLAPDNGVLSLAIARHGLRLARQVAVPPTASGTFHGRDVFAPTAAELVCGVETGLLGPITDLVSQPWPLPQATAGGLSGEVIHVDHFGNLITNLPDTYLPRLQAAGQITCGDRQIDQIVRTYGEAAPGSLVALAGSQGFLEVAVVEGRAAERLSAGRGTPVQLP